MSTRENLDAATDSYDVPERCFASPAAFVGLLQHLDPEALKRTIGSVGARRVHRGRVTFCDVVMGALQMGRNPVELLRSWDIL